jgi:hypothetical protein
MEADRCMRPPTRGLLLTIHVAQRQEHASTLTVTTTANDIAAAAAAATAAATTAAASVTTAAEVATSQSAAGGGVAPAPDGGHPLPQRVAAAPLRTAGGRLRTAQRRGWECTLHSSTRRNTRVHTHRCATQPHADTDSARGLHCPFPPPSRTHTPRTAQGLDSEVGE